MSDDEPVIAQKSPFTVAVEKGKDYWWCSCGRSSNQPFCNGAHKGTAFTPRKFTAEKSGELHLCGCKHTANPPLCDGGHKKV